MNYNTIDTENAYTSGVYSKRDVVIVRAKGTRLWDENGKEYIDCVAGQGVANIGHCHPQVTKAIQEQSNTLVICTEMFYNDTRAKLLQKLIAVLPQNIQRAYLCNSGTEAIEAALKFARLATQKKGIIATMRGFHGRTMGALSTTWEKKYREPFEPLLPNVKHVPYGKIEKIKDSLSNDVGAIIIEIVQGEGGVHPGQQEYFSDLRQLCDENNIILIIDEVQTGFGRTGKWFACEHYGLEPDIITMGKAIAGGIPMGAVGISNKIVGLEPGTHGSTFGGNPLACAAAIASLDVYESENLIKRAEEMGFYLKTQLEKIESPIIREVRGLGLMIGIELKIKVRPLLAELTEKGVMALPAGLTVLRLLPPLTIAKEEIDIVVDAIKKTIQENESTS